MFMGGRSVTKKTTRTKTIAQGKLPARLLTSLISQLPMSTSDNGVVIPPGIGLDAAGLNVDDKLLAVTTDPITFTTDQIGTYSVAVNINDVACLGCNPRWFTATLLLPVGTTEEILTGIWNNVVAALVRYNVTAIGGHIEVTPTVNIPIIVGQMIGEAIDNHLLDVRHGQPQDKILLVRHIALEGVSIIAKAFPEKLQPHFTATQIYKLQNFINDPGICILPVVKKLLPCSGLIGMHDTTEGGIATALHDIADACNCGLRVNYEEILFLPEMQKLAAIFSFDPLGIIASGSVLLICRPDAVAAIKEKLGNSGGEALAVIGELTADSTQRVMYKNDREVPIPRYDADEIIRVLNG